MIPKTSPILMVLVCFILFCVGPVNAAINTISQGNTVFIGEEGLDISAAMGPYTQISWWPPAADISTTASPNTINVKTRITDFEVTPSEFSRYTGNWYRVNDMGKADGVAFLVAEPYLEIKAEDATRDVDVDLLKWIPTGDDIQFRIDNNLAQMWFQRGSPPLITIKVQSPEGSVYSALFNAGGMPTSIEDMPVTKTQYFTGPIWNMGNPDRYAYGTYTIWAESNVNHMYDNYDREGKTISKKITLLNQAVNPLISTATTIPTETKGTLTPVTTNVTTRVTTQAVITTTVKTPSPAGSPTISSTVIPSSSQTKAPGFGVTLAIFAILFGLVAFLKKG